MSVSPNTTTNTIKELVLGYTDDSSIYRDTEISRYWYRACLDTFWYRDTKSIAILFDTFCRYCTWLNLLIRCFGNFVTLMVSVGLILRFLHVLVRLHFALVQTISLINLKLSISINVEISYAFYPGAAPRPVLAGPMPCHWKFGTWRWDLTDILIRYAGKA